MVAFGVDPDEMERADSYMVWRMGKAPDFVMEVASKSTWRRDLTIKRDLYARIGVPEHWLFDPTGGDFYGEPLMGETLVDGQYRRNETRIGDTGVVMWHSPVLGLWLYAEDGRLNFYDPVQMRRINTLIEEREARQAAEADRDAERQALRAAEDEIERLREQLRLQSG